MRIILLLAAACLLTIPAVTANHDGNDSPLSCDDRLVTNHRDPCMDYCIHGMGTEYRISRDDPTNVFPGNCWAS